MFIRSFLVTSLVAATSVFPLEAKTIDAQPALKDVFAGDFLVGGALGGWLISRPDSPARDLSAHHFNSVTPTNLLKWERYNPEPGVYRTDPVDEFLAFAEANDQHVLGHVLFWHQQTPEWVFQDEHGDPISREALIERMRERVRHVAENYGDRIDAWDVINETFEDNGALRDSNWTRVLGEDFIFEAFRIANEELPADVELLYNDYSMHHPGRRDSVVKMIHDLRSRGLRIDAVGMQGHWRIDGPDVEAIEASILAFAGAGVRVHITELDIEMLPRKSGADLNDNLQLTEENNPYAAGLPEEKQQELARRYADIFTLFLKHRDLIDRVTFWGVTDRDSWLNNWPVRGRTNYPLLFDREGNAKPAFDAVVALKRDS